MPTRPGHASLMVAVRRTERAWFLSVLAPTGTMRLALPTAGPSGGAWLSMVEAEQ
jgi:hypothetical protein